MTDPQTESVSTDCVSHWLSLAKTAAAAVVDPELPFLTVSDLGILREVTFEAGRLHISVSPTYSGCPAVSVIESLIREAVTHALEADAADSGLNMTLPDVVVDRALSPAWTTDDLSSEAQRKLLANGIAPPLPLTDTTTSATLATSAVTLFDEPSVNCPRCDAADTEKISAFGSTPCKAQYRCNVCLEPFDYFKCLR